jgi:hypothetical protein
MKLAPITNNVLHMQIGLLKTNTRLLNRESPDPEAVDAAIALSERITTTLKEIRSNVIEEKK